MGIGDKPTPAQCNVVQTDQIWKDYVHHEAQAVKKWEDTWGFLKGEYQQLGESITTQRSKHPIQQQHSRLPRARESLKLPPLPQHKLPKQRRTDFPMTTTMEIGWRLARRENSLERYGCWGRPKGSILKQLGWPRDAMP